MASGLPRLSQLQTVGVLAAARRSETASLIEGRRRRGFRSEADAPKDAGRARQQRRHQRAADPRTTERRQHIDAPQASDLAIAGVGVAVEAADRDEVVADQGSKQAFSGPVKPVDAGAPLGFQTTHKGEAFRIRRSTQALKSLR